MSNLGSTLAQRGRGDEGIAWLQRAVDLQPAVAAYGINLGLALCRQREFAAAERVLRAVAGQHAGDAAAAFNLGVALRGLGRDAEAADEYRRAIAIQPDYTDALINLGNACRELGDLAQAAAAYRRALELAPHSIEALNNAGCLARTLGRLDEAEDHLRHGIGLDPGNAVLHDNLGNVLKDAGRAGRGDRVFREALRLDPRKPAHTAILLCTVVPVRRARTRYSRNASGGTRASRRPVAPRDAGRMPRSVARPALEHRLRIRGFRDHCQTLFTCRCSRGTTTRLSRSSAIRASCGPMRYTERIAAHADAWREVRGLDDAALAAQIRADESTCSSTSTMHMADGRPLLFARKPAPVQIAWLAYPGTTGHGRDRLSAERPAPGPGR